MATVWCSFSEQERPVNAEQKGHVESVRVPWPTFHLDQGVCVSEAGQDALIHEAVWETPLRAEDSPQRHQHLSQTLWSWI
jgi:hypothetical protein